jgi:hypothetical protein
MALLIKYLKCLENVFLDYSGIKLPIVQVIDIKNIFKITDFYFSSSDVENISGGVIDSL